MSARRLRIVLAATLAVFQCILPIESSRRLGPPVAQAQSLYYSDLWGQEGEKWEPRSRLPDFSFAGYHAGDKALPTVPIKTNVKDFGAQGDGTTDDTAAFKRAIAATSHGALYIPAGRYKLTDRLTIDKSHVVLRGAGEGKTVLYMARSLKQILGTAPYGWEGALAVRGQDLGSS